MFRYDSQDTSKVETFADGIVLGYGPEGSAFDGLLVLKNDVAGNVQLVDPTSGSGVQLLTGVTDGVGESAAFYPNDSTAVLYISQWGLRRILRVSTERLEPTLLGCPN